MRLISRLGRLHRFGYLWAHFSLAGRLLHSPSGRAVWEVQGGAGAQAWALPPGPASGFLLITQISNRCGEAEHLIFVPQCVFFK